MKATIRFANAQDYVPLLDLFELVDTFHRENLPTIFQKPAGPARDQDYFESLLLDQENGLFIAEVEDEIAGFILAILHDYTPILRIHTLTSGFGFRYRCENRIQTAGNWSPACE